MLRSDDLAPDILMLCVRGTEQFTDKSQKTVFMSTHTPNSRNWTSQFVSYCPKKIRFNLIDYSTNEEENANQNPCLAMVFVL
jgi:hypothetical protein